MMIFIAKSLSVSLNKKNLKEIQQDLKLKKINWELFVKISSSQLVIPTLYCNYKRKNLLQFLPTKLVIFMKEITDLNRDRNMQIIKQINSLNTLLKKKGVNPIFLKGASYLIHGLYEDPAERMVGDIDFLVSKNEFDLAVKILTDKNYKSVSDLGYHFPFFKHYPRLCNKDEIASVEIHKEMLVEKYSQEFNYETIKNDVVQKNDFCDLSNDDKKALSIFSNLINDYGFDYKTVNLKNAYDFLLLNSKDLGIAFASRYDKLRAPIIFFVGSVNYLFGDMIKIDIDIRKPNKHLKKFKLLLHNSKRRKFHSKIIRFKLAWNYRKNYF